jgi:4-diphosphocytidyl-2-C-methyl-D-erythritol kinase
VTASSPRTARAPAKINLTLHVLGRRAADGYHELQSLVAFAGVGDHLAFSPGADLSLKVDGPTADDAGPGPDNLVQGLRVGAFHLNKYLPVAAGVGGGSSDAAAALRLLAQENGIALDDRRLIDAARATGADVPVCVEACAREMAGVGEQLGEKLDLAPIPAVLVNPRVAVETRAVFAKLGLKADQSYGFGKHPRIDAKMPPDALIAALKKGRNDLEDPACVISREIVDVLAVLGAARGARLARMSGSGATCFALFADRHQAARAARTIRRDHPGWWAHATLLR